MLGKKTNIIKMENKKNRVYKTIMLMVLTAFVTFMLTVFLMYSYFSNTVQGVNNT